MAILIWLFIFAVSLAVLVKSADWFVESAEVIGIALKISPFVVGVVIVAVGTSLPELASSLFAVFKKTGEIVAANVIGSNIANILLIVGLSAVAAKRIIVKRSLIDLDAPLLASATVIFIFIALDRKIVFWEGLFLILTFFVYILYTISQRKEEQELEGEEIVEVLPGRDVRREKAAEKIEKKENKLSFKVFFYLVLGAAGLTLGADYTIESVVKLSQLLKIATSFIAITAVAIGTSLPELVVSLQAARKKKYEIALGNVFGSNVFNFMLVAGLPALISDLPLDNLTFSIGLPFLASATLIFVISTISKRIHIWEGIMYLLIYAVFIIKLAGIF
jgi:cation:H+ antiporter